MCGFSYTNLYTYIHIWRENIIGFLIIFRKATWTSWFSSQLILSMAHDGSFSYVGAGPYNPRLWPMICFLKCAGQNERRILGWWLWLMTYYDYIVRKPPALMFRIFNEFQWITRSAHVQQMEPVESSSHLMLHRGNAVAGCPPCRCEDSNSGNASWLVLASSPACARSWSF